VNTLAAVMVALSGLWLSGLAIAAFAWPERVKDFFGKFASSAFYAFLGNVCPDDRRHGVRYLCTSDEVLRRLYRIWLAIDIDDRYSFSNAVEDA
jgi:hypothetical protein